MNQANLLVTRMLITFNDTEKTTVSFFLFKNGYFFFFCFLKFFLTASLQAAFISIKNNRIGLSLKKAHNLYCCENEMMDLAFVVISLKSNVAFTKNMYG